MGIGGVLERFGFIETRFDLLAEAEKKLVSQRDVPLPGPETFYRISGLSKMCPREEVLRARHVVPKRDVVDAKLRRVFDFGHAFHSLVQNEWFGRWGWLWGTWRCDSCRAETLEALRPLKCRDCGGDGFVYVEPTIKDESHFLTGHSDGILVWNGRKHVIELKTCNSQVFKFLVKNSPLNEHLDQVNLYMHYLGIKSGFVVYFSKDDASWRVFQVTFDRDRVAKLLGKIRLVKRVLMDSAEKVPPREMCSTDACSRARVCSTRKICFSN